MALMPALTLRDVVGPGHRLVFRAGETRSRWVQPDPMIRDALGAGGLSTCGDIPYLVSAATVTSRILRLMKRAGVLYPERVDTFHGADDYSRRLSEFIGKEGRLITQHVYADDEIAPERSWIPPRLLSWLNNKGNLHELVPHDAVARRRIVPFALLRENPPPLPCVVKAATEDSTGGGLAVVLCRTEKDLLVAERTFADVSRLVIEEFLDIERSWCLNFALLHDGRLKYLGAGEQVCTVEGRFAGNWIDRGPVPSEAIAAATQAVMRGAALGYYGFAGIDVALTPEGVFVLDLNFRYNASTSPLLLFDALCAERGNVVIRSARFPVQGADWEGETARAIDSGRLIPNFVFDPEGTRFHDRPPYMSALIIGTDREDVNRWLAAFRE